MDTVTCVSPIRLFSRKTGVLKKGKEIKKTAGCQKVPVILNITLDGDTHITVSITKIIKIIRTALLLKNIKHRDRNQTVF